MTGYLPDGLPAPAATGLSAPYWEATRQGVLKIQFCRGCDQWQWGPEWICHRCHGFDLDWRPVAPDFLAVPGFLRKHFICSADGREAGGSYLWESLAAAEAFYAGPWVDGIRQRYGCEPRISYYETVAIADRASGFTGGV